MKRDDRQIEPHVLELHSVSEAQTRLMAAAMARHLAGGDFIALEGELGAGKTVFVRGLAEGLGINPRVVSSPTFVIRNEYSDPDAIWSLIHVDAYRLSGPDELETIGWSELLRDQDAIIAVEWPSRLAAAIPDKRFDAAIEHVDQHARLIRISAAHRSLIPRLADLHESMAAVGATQHTCRMCGTTVTVASRAFPFCSERCRLADLGKWFNEGYRVSRPVQADEELSD